jgi:catechol 2,3-dioxygenase-like lactoylglutathione lyase family enzyme
MPLLTGIHHVSVPTSDPVAGSDWYVRVFGFAAVLITRLTNLPGHYI